MKYSNVYHFDTFSYFCSLASLVLAFAHVFKSFIKRDSILFFRLDI